MVVVVVVLLVAAGQKHLHEQSLAKPRYVRIAGCGCGVLSLLQKEHPECPTRPGEARQVSTTTVPHNSTCGQDSSQDHQTRARPPPSLLPCPSPDDVRLVVSARETLCQLYADG